MKKESKVFIGIIFVVIGFLLACSAVGILDFFDFIFFPGFWTLFIILPCLYGFMKKGQDKTGYVIGLIVGICFLINEQNFKFHIDFWPMMLAVLFLLIGRNLIFSKKAPKIDISFSSSETSGVHKTYTSSSNKSGYLSISAILSGKDIRVDNEVFAGGDVCTILGGIDLDLRNAVITGDVYLNVIAILGGVDIYLPPNVRVVADDCTAVLGGVDVNQAYANYLDPNVPRVIISGSCILGGMDVK